MNFFKSIRQHQGASGSAPRAAASAGLPQASQALPASPNAHSQFIKRVSRTRCGAPKTLPSATAYLYCDYF